jgi:tetratricopeptide (TPR) repeat protein
VDAVCGIGISLADALEHAHSRGLLHLDVKPSNVLIAADGVPMLLDFHLARPPLSAGAAPPAWLGGTPEYMAPELAAAVEAVRRGEPVPGAVDGRADVYSLGLLLGEALGRAAGAKHPDVPTGLSDILARCTAPDPADRYASTAQVAADLRRHLADLPLRGVPNRSAGERWRKWRRRSPLTLPGLVIGTACALLAVGFGLDADTRIERARTALREGELHLQSGRFTESVETFRGGETRLKGVPFTAALGHKLRTGRANAERARAATELHQFCERVRPFYAAELVTTADASEAFARCRELWAQRQQIAANLDEQPASELDRRWRADVLDVGILTAHLLARRAAPAEREAAHRQALAILDEAGSLLGPSAGLYRERAVHARALGFQALEAEANSRAASVPPRTAWEHLIAGRTFFAAGDFARAATAFDQSLELDPGSLWGNNYRGLTLLRLSDFNGAAAAFSVCVALAPRTAWCYTNRGLAHTEAGRLDRAGVDFDRALAIDPNGAAALIGRATVRYRSGRFAEAHADLRLAHAAGAPAATVHYHAAAVHLAAGDRRAAVAALRDCLVSDPHHPDARSALARLDPNP